MSMEKDLLEILRTLPAEDREKILRQAINLQERREAQKYAAILSTAGRDFVDTLRKREVPVDGKVITVKVVNGNVDVAMKVYNPGERTRGKPIRVWPRGQPGKAQDFANAREACEALGLTVGQYGPVHTLRSHKFEYTYIEQ